MSQTSAPKTFQQIFGDLVVKEISKTSVADLQPGSVLNTLLKQVEEVNQYSQLYRFLKKLDARFKVADPWHELKIAQRTRIVLFTSKIRD
jgi:hypothetical protein